MTNHAHDCFDYIMNTRRTYEMLGEAVCLLERLAARERRTVEALLKEEGAGAKRGGWSPSSRKWWRVLRETLRLAMSDWLLNFVEEEPGWFKSRSYTLNGCTEVDVMQVALAHRDRWTEKR